MPPSPPDDRRALSCPAWQGTPTAPNGLRGRRARDTGLVGATPLGAARTKPLGVARAWLAPAQARNVGWFTSGEVARAMGVSDRTVRSWCARGLLHSEVLPSGHRRIAAHALEAFRGGGSFTDQVQPHDDLSAAREVLAALEAKMRITPAREIGPLIAERARLELEYGL